MSFYRMYTKQTRIFGFYKYGLESYETKWSIIFEDHLLSPMDPMDIYWSLLTLTLDPTPSRPPIMLVYACDPINLKRISLNSLLALFYTLRIVECYFT